MWGSYSWLKTIRLYTSHVELETLGTFMCMYMMVTDVSIRRWALTLPKFGKPFGPRFHFEKFWGNRCWLMWGSYSCLKTTRLYTSPCRVGNSLGFHVYVHDGYRHVNKEMGSHTTKIWWAFRPTVPFWKILREPMLVNVKVVLLVEDGKTIYILCRVGNSWDFHVYVHDDHGCINKEMDSHITKNWWAFWPTVPFWKKFGNRCRLMWRSYSWLKTTKLYTSHVELETLGTFMCMYMMTMDASTRRWTLTLPKFDEPFSLQFHFENFLGNRCWSMWRSYSWLKTIRLYTSYVELETLGTFMCMYMMIMDASTRRCTLTSSKIDEPSGPRFHFEKILGTDVGRCEGHTLGWRRQDYIHPM